MSCEPARPCGPPEAGLGVVAPPPGLTYLARRPGWFGDFLDDLVATVERRPDADGVLGDRWDLEGDPRAMEIVELWALVADGVSTYAELTANEAYLATARDWTDLRRLAALVGYRPAPLVAATGWVQVDVDRGAGPIVPAGTVVQAPAAPPGRPDAQKYEVIADTVLRPDHAGLTATWVPQPEPPPGRQVRFLGDPGFGAGDRVLLVLEEHAGPTPVPGSWFSFWLWLVVALQGTPAGSTALAVTNAVARDAELGTTVVTFDRDVSSLLSTVDKPYAAYRVRATAGSARHLTKVLKFAVDPATFAIPGTTGGSAFYDTGSAITATSVVLDAALDDLSAGQQVAVVDWAVAPAACDVVTVQRHTPVHWEAAPGAPTRVSMLTFGAEVSTLKSAMAAGRPVTVYVLDRREVAQHYVFPDAPPAAAPSSVRLYPAPEVAPVRVAVDVGSGEGDPVWEVVEVTPSADQESTGAAGVTVPVGLIVDVAGTPPSFSGRTRADANLVAVHHGATTNVVLGSGDVTIADLRLTTPDAPIAYDLDDAGEVTPSMVVRVDGVAWPEVPTRYVTPPVPEHEVELGADGGVTVVFGDGDHGARPATGRNNIAATYRVGGGSEGEVATGAITALVGSVRGVRKVRGAGPTSGGADQDDERRIRSLVPSRARALGRAVSLDDLADLAAAYPGISHATAWRGPGPPGCPCGGTGLHVAVLRFGSGGRPRAPLAAELTSLRGHLDGRRDTSVPVCVCAGTATTVGVHATLVVDPARVANQVVAAATAALVDPDGPLAPANRRQGQPLDHSDLVSVLHQAAGVVGVTDLVVTGSTVVATLDELDLGRQPAARWELLLVPDAPSLGTVTP